ncbi:MAG: 1-acyl-sn-glycerol-3-phosphate acyltransferase [Cyanobium sp.]
MEDPAVLARMLWHELPRHGDFRPRPHVQFLYDRGIPLWAGESVGWLLSRLGGCSIQRGTLDLPALRTARALLLDGPYPFAVAPEGATNGHNEVVSPLEPGVAQLALWTADDLERAGRPERTVVLPLGVQYAFTRPVWPALEALIAQMEQDAGLPPVAADPAPGPGTLYPRLLALAGRILSRMETFYREAYQRNLPIPPTDLDPTADLGGRLSRLLEAALGVVEQSLAVETHGDWGERCRRLEQVGWERQYSAMGASPCALERGLAERLAEETAQRLWHMRLVESFVAVSGRYVRERPSQERFADTLLILWDTLCRIRGGTPERRPRLGPRRAVVRIGEPLAMEMWLQAYRRQRRTAVADLTTELQQRLEALIVSSQAPGAGL